MDVDGVRDGVQVGRKVRMTNEGPAAARCDLGGKSSRPGREASSLRQQLLIKPCLDLEEVWVGAPSFAPSA